MNSVLFKSGQGRPTSNPRPFEQIIKVNRRLGKLRLSDMHKRSKLIWINAEISSGQKNI